MVYIRYQTTEGWVRSGLNLFVDVGKDGYLQSELPYLSEK